MTPRQRLSEIHELLTHTGLADVELSDVHYLIAYAQSLEAEVKVLREGYEEVDYETYPGEPTDLILKRTLAKADQIAKEREKS